MQTRLAPTARKRPEHASARRMLLPRVARALLILRILLAPWTPAMVSASCREQTSPVRGRAFAFRCRDSGRLCISSTSFGFHTPKCRATFPCSNRPPPNNQVTTAAPFAGDINDLYAFGGR